MLSLGGLFTALVVSILLGVQQPKIAEAACGASTSSCKTCHEVQGKDPVSQKGDWHTQHSFGDFCQACHLGNATATDKAQAHQGMIKNPLTQADQTCASCHPSDTAARVAKYGGTAGATTTKPSGTSSGAASGSASAAGSSTSAGSTSPSAAATQTPSTAPSTAATQAPAASNPNYDVIDYNKNFSNLNIWTVLFGVADILIVLALIVLLWRWKKGVWLWQYMQHHKDAEILINLEKETPEIKTIFNLLHDCETDTVIAVESLLKRGKDGQRLLQTVAGLSPELLGKLQSLKESDMDLVFQLSRAMRTKEGKHDA